MRIRLMMICMILLGSYIHAQARNSGSSPPLPKEIPVELFDKAVELIKEFEGWHPEKHYPYIGYGHNYPNLDIILTLYCK